MLTAILMASLKPLLLKLASQETLEALLIFVVEIVAKSSKTPYGDEIVAKVKEILSQPAPKA